MEVTNPQSTSDNVSSPEKSGSPNSFGATLKRAREQKKATLDEAADTLHILKRHLEALEAEDFEKLPQATFARGFTINYAKYLGLDPHEMVKAFDAVYPTQLKEESRHSETNTPLKPLGTLQRDSRRPKLRINPFLVLGVIALVVLAVFLLRTVSNARQDTPTDVEEVALDDISRAEQIQGASLDGTTASVSEEVGNVATGSAIGVVTPTSGTDSGNTSTNAAEAKLEFWVRGNTDINVTDATGQSLMSGNQPRGGYTLSGVPPFQVQISKVSNVALNLNQEKVALTQYAQNNQANFSLSP